MLRSELILKLQNKYPSLSSNDIEKIINLFFKKIFLGLSDNKKIEIRGFGTFSSKLNKEKYLQYFIDCHKDKDPEIGTLTADDLRASRIVVVDPAPIPAAELARTAEWIKSWGMLTETEDHLDRVNMDVQQGAHAAAE